MTQRQDISKLTHAADALLKEIQQLNARTHNQFADIKASRKITANVKAEIQSADDRPSRTKSAPVTISSIRFVKVVEGFHRDAEDHRKLNVELEGLIWMIEARLGGLNEHPVLYSDQIRKLTASLYALKNSDSIQQFKTNLQKFITNSNAITPPASPSSDCMDTSSSCSSSPHTPNSSRSTASTSPRESPRKVTFDPIVEVATYIKPDADATPKPTKASPSKNRPASPRAADKENSRLNEDINGSEEDLALTIYRQTSCAGNKYVMPTTLQQTYITYDSEKPGSMNSVFSFHSYSAATNIGFAQLHGRNRSNKTDARKQEDTLCYGRIPSFKKLTRAQRLAVLQQTIHELEATISKDHPNTKASTSASGFIVCGAEVYYINVGNSMVYRCQYSTTEDKATTFKRATTISDKSIKSDMIYTPQIRVENIALGKNELVIFIAATDGILPPCEFYETKAEAAATNAFNLEEVVEKNLGVVTKKTSPGSPRTVSSYVAELLPKEIANDIHALGMRDNATLVTLALADTHPNRVTYGMVFDGEHGREAASTCAKTFHEILLQKIKCQLELARLKATKTSVANAPRWLTTFGLNKTTDDVGKEEVEVAATAKMRRASM